MSNLPLNVVTDILTSALIRLSVVSATENPRVEILREIADDIEDALLELRGAIKSAE